MKNLGKFAAVQTHLRDDIHFWDQFKYVPVHMFQVIFKALTIIKFNLVFVEVFIDISKV